MIANQSQNRAEKLAFTLLDNTYKIGPSFKHGGYSHVYYAEDNNRNKFAIKVTSLELKNKPEDKKQSILRSLQHESEMMMICSSQHTMKCVNALYDEEEKLKFIVMELCEYGSLQDLIYLKGHLTENESKIILKHSLCGLFEIHRHGLYHRDIKSANVCFNKCHCVICDFGCSKEFLDEEQIKNWRGSYRKNGTVTGTIISQSPQMLSGQKYGFQTDLWAIGILLYQMLTGVPPFIFKSNITDEQAVQFIRNNVDKIYDSEYISKNLQELEMTRRGNKRISPEAQNFLKKVLVFDQFKRISWRHLINQQYLLSVADKEKQGISSCFLPLKDINWKQFSVQIEKYCIGETIVKKTVKLLQKTKKVSYKMKTLDVVTRKQLIQSANEQNERQEQVYRQLKIVDFEVKRLNLLLQLRGNLENLQKKNSKLKCDKVGLLIVMFCYLKSRQLEANMQDKNIQFVKQRLDLTAFNKLIHATYMADQAGFREDHNEDSPINILKSIIVYKKQKIDFYTDIKKQSFQTVLKNIEPQTKKLHKRIKEFEPSQEIQYIEFFEKPELLLKAKYIPNKNETVWRQWDSFGSIIQYQLANMKNSK